MPPARSATLTGVPVDALTMDSRGATVCVAANKTVAADADKRAVASRWLGRRDGLEYDLRARAAACP